MTEKRGPGRPRKYPAGTAGSNLTFRTRGNLRARLGEAASLSGRSVSEEIEYRLERSFWHDDVLKALDRGTLPTWRDVLDVRTQ
jgi:hypothetical protein